MSKEEQLKRLNERIISKVIRINSLKNKKYKVFTIRRLNSQLRPLLRKSHELKSRT